MVILSEPSLSVLELNVNPGTVLIRMNGGRSILC